MQICKIYAKISKQICKIYLSDFTPPAIFDVAKDVIRAIFVASSRVYYFMYFQVFLYF